MPRVFSDNFDGIVRTTGVGLARNKSTKIQPDDEVPYLKAGLGAPTYSAPNGSVYCRENGGAASTVYARVSGAWVALGDAVTLSLGDDEVLYFGAGSDIGLEYDENGTDDLRFVQGASTPDLVFPDSMLCIFGTDKDASIANDGSTGLQVLIADNDADAFEIAQGANVYFHCDTRNDQERVVTSKIQAWATQTIDMADAQVALVYGTAGAGQVKVTGQVLLVDANSSGTEDLLLPAEATSTGVVFFICNTGGEDIVVKEDSDTTTICTISTAESAFVACDGTTWRGGVVKAT